MAKQPTTTTTQTDLVKTTYPALELAHQPPPTVNNFEDDERQTSALNFPRIVMPKGKVWEKFGDHEDTPLKSFQAIVIFHHETRAWWKEPESKGAPDCWSLDGKIGTTQGQCDGCPLKKSGCKGSRKLYLALLDGQGIPSHKLYTMLLPVTAQVVFQKAMKALEKQGVGYRQIAMTFRLKDAESQSGQPYVRLAFNLANEDACEVEKDYTVLDADTQGKADLLYHALKAQWLKERAAIEEQSRAARRETAILVAATPVAATPVVSRTIELLQTEAAVAPWEE